MLQKIECWLESHRGENCNHEGNEDGSQHLEDQSDGCRGKDRQTSPLTAELGSDSVDILSREAGKLILHDISNENRPNRQARCGAHAAGRPKRKTSRTSRHNQLRQLYLNSVYSNPPC